MHTLVTFFVLVGFVIPIAATAAPGRPLVPGGPRIRPGDNRTTGILLEGLQRSDTLRALVDLVETKDVIVYLQMQPLLKGRLAGTVTWITKAARFRYVKISISPDLSGDTAIAALGHELQHVLEIADEPSVVDADSLTEFYRRVGISIRSHINGWDTLAARDRGDEVRRDLSQTRGNRISESARDFDPLDWQVVYRSMRERRR